MGQVGFMGSMSEAAAGLRAELEAAVLASVERFGTEGWPRDSIIKKFTDRGVSRSTAYRWVGGVLASGRPGQHMAAVVRAAVSARAAREADPARAAAVEAGAKLPRVVTVDDIAATGVLNVVQQLNSCVAVAHELIAHARTIDGGVRNAKLLLSASEHLRRNLETAARITELMLRSDRIEKFHIAIIEELSRESPALAERAAMRLANLANRWAT
jgi:hypothetical protein